MNAFLCSCCTDFVGFCNSSFKASFVQLSSLILKLYLCISLLCTTTPPMEVRGQMLGCRSRLPLCSAVSQGSPGQAASDSSACSVWALVRGLVSLSGLPCESFCSLSCLFLVKDPSMVGILFFLLLVGPCSFCWRL